MKGFNDAIVATVGFVIFLFVIITAAVKAPAPVFDDMPIRVEDDTAVRFFNGGQWTVKAWDDFPAILADAQENWWQLATDDIPCVLATISINGDVGCRGFDEDGFVTWLTIFDSEPIDIPTAEVGTYLRNWRVSYINNPDCSILTFSEDGSVTCHLTVEDLFGGTQ